MYFATLSSCFESLFSDLVSPYIWRRIVHDGGTQEASDSLVLNSVLTQLIALEECNENILPRDRVAIDGVWVGSRIN
jgi:hypothetical protein